MPQHRFPVLSHLIQQMFRSVLMTALGNAGGESRWDDGTRWGNHGMCHLVDVGPGEF